MIADILGVEAQDNDVIHDALMRHAVADDSAIPPVQNSTLAASTRPRRMSGPASPAFGLIIRVATMIRDQSPRQAGAGLLKFVQIFGRHLAPAVR